VWRLDSNQKYFDVDVLSIDGNDRIRFSGDEWLLVYGPTSPIEKASFVERSALFFRAPHEFLKVFERHSTEEPEMWDPADFHGIWLTPPEVERELYRQHLHVSEPLLWIRKFDYSQLSGKDYLAYIVGIAFARIHHLKANCVNVTVGPPIKLSAPVMSACWDSQVLIVGVGSALEPSNFPLTKICVQAAEKRNCIGVQTLWLLRPS
jgi:hypothetical protein